MADLETVVGLTEEEGEMALSPMLRLGAEKTMSKGVKLAWSIAEHWLMKQFFPEMRDKKKQMREKDLFARDMQYHITKGRVTRATTKLMNKID